MFRYRVCRSFVDIAACISNKRCLFGNEIQNINDDLKAKYASLLRGRKNEKLKATGLMDLFLDVVFFKPCKVSVD